MELDEMKKTWNALDTKLNKIQLLQDSFIREMTRTKINRSIDRLRNWEIFGALIVMLVIPLIVYNYIYAQVELLFWSIFQALAFVVCVAITVWQIAKVRVLMRIDYTKGVKENIHWVNRFRIMYSREKIAMNIIGPVMLMLIIILYAQLQAKVYQWALMVTAFLGAALYCYWAYQVMIKRKLPTIIKSLEELKELEDDE